MRLVVDANVLFAALIREGLTSELLLSNRLQLYAPEFLLTEFEKYENYILKKTSRNHNDFLEFLNIVKRRIIFIDREEILPFLEIGIKITPDPKDVPYISLALAINSKIWSNDKELKKNQSQIEVLSTEELLKFLDYFEKD